jgi:DNA-binding transcriptional ArsR family regulator
MARFKPFMTEQPIERDGGITREPRMGPDSLATDRPRLQDVLDALDDPECRSIVERLAEPMTAKEVSNSCDIPLSTTYRKLGLLDDASLVEERTEVRVSGRHTSRYAIDFEAVRVALDDDRLFEVAIEQPERTPDEQLSELWAEVRKK